MPRSDADSTSNALAAVGAPSETRIWQHYHDVLDEQGQPIVSNNRKSRVCNYCGHEFKHLSLEQAVKHLDKCEEAQQQVDGLSALIDQVNLDRSAKKEKALVKSQQPARSRSILGKHARDSIQSTLDSRAKAIRVAPDEQMTIDTAMLHFFVMCNIAFNVADSPWFRRIFRFLHPGYKPPSKSQTCCSFSILTCRHCMDSCAGLQLPISCGHRS